MDLSGRPLLDTDVDRALFAGREAEFERLVAAVEQRRNTLVIGERGAGKTTMLRQCALELRRRHPDSPPPLFVEGGLANDVRTFLELVRYRAGLPPEAPDHPFDSLARDARLDDSLELPRLVAGLAEASVGGDRIVLVDDLPASPVGETLFGRLRDELWQLPLTWVVAVTPADAGSYLAPPADAFFDERIELGPLSEMQRVQLLEARGGPEASRLATEIDEGNPRRLLAIVRRALEEGRSADDFARERDERSQRLSRVSEPAQALLQELESLGAASASDEPLLRRLGWTRPRAVQLFAELEREGLVTSSQVKGSAGRPRKVYRPADGSPS
jgi:AAA ATPase domain